VRAKATMTVITDFSEGHREDGSVVKNTGNLKNMAVLAIGERFFVS
jgi:hypothetical protein